MKRITNASLRLEWTESRYKNERDAKLVPAGMILRVTFPDRHTTYARWNLYVADASGNARDYLTGGPLKDVKTELQIKAAAEEKVLGLAEALRLSLSQRTPKADASAA